MRFGKEITQYLIVDEEPKLLLLVLLTFSLITILHLVFKMIKKIGNKFKSKILNSSLVQSK